MPVLWETEELGFIQTRKLFQCHECGKQTGVTAGTILQDAKLELSTWFLLHKLLEVLGKGPAGQLFGIVEVDEAFLECKRGKGGRASNAQMVMGLWRGGRVGL